MIKAPNTSAGAENHLERYNMKTNAPKSTTWWIAVVLIAVGFISVMLMGRINLGFLQQGRCYYWLTFAGGALLALSTVFKGL